MEKQTKLQEEELQELQDFQNQSGDLIDQLGQLAFKKLRFENEENYLKAQYQNLIIKEKEMSDKFKEKYGNIQIDIKTGDITYPL
jgi:hypothetical protein